MSEARDTKVNGVSAEENGIGLIQELHAILADLSAQVAYQGRHLAALGQHLEGLDKVVGQLTAEVKDRLEHLEQQTRPRLRSTTRPGRETPRR
ncbi:hypothetical protein BH24ACT1_BH24ACT1_09450 [soil metagenome]